MNPSHDHAGGMDCQETFRRLDDYVDRELTPEEQRAVAAHIEACARCATEFRVEQELLDALKAKLRRIAAPAGLLEKIAAKIETEG